MRNGICCRRLQRLSISARLQDTPEQWMEHIQIGVQECSGDTWFGSQSGCASLYCSAMPVSYSGIHPQIWEPLGRLVLNAAYELSVRLAVEHAEQTGSKTLYLTLLGGGAFGNPTEWITDAIWRALKIVEWSGLDVVVVSYGTSHPAVHRLVQSWKGDSGY